MNYENDGEGEGWTWPGPSPALEDNTKTGEEWTFNGTTTPLKACGGLSHHLAGANGVHGKEIEQYKEPSYSQIKKRRILYFDADSVDASLCNNEIYLRSLETEDTLEDKMTELSEWVSGFADGTNLFSNEQLDPSSERWIYECLNDDVTHFSTDDAQNRIASGPSNIQNDITEPCGNSVEYDPNVIEKLPVHTTQNITLKGKKSYMRAPPKLASSIVYPFTFIKPCGAHGDMTLSDINQLLHTPKPAKTEQDPSLSYPTSAFSGKPVVGKMKIRTEGGEGSITIVRTKG